MLTYAQWLEAPEYEQNDPGYADYQDRWTRENPPRQLSPQQAAVVDFVRDGTGSAFVQARAGTGKTTTMIEALKETQGYVSFAAYNTKIAKEIQGKVAKLNLGNRVRVGTFHSFGLSCWKRAYPQVKFGPEADKDKYDMSVAQMVKTGVPEQLHSFVMKLVLHAKGAALGLYGQVEDKSRWHSIIDHHDMAYDLDDSEGLNDPEGVSRLIEQGVDTAIRMLNWHRALGGKIINFDDMLYLPVVSGVRPFEVDWMFTDEAQDTNPARRALARKMLKRNGRALFVGDDRQAIYGFTGADSDAIDQIIRDFNCATLPLTVTYRCPKSVVAEANKYVPDIEAHESAPEGKVSHGDYECVVQGLSTGSSFSGQHVELTADDAIICRNTKPLVQAAYTLIKRGVACHVEGRDIGAGLIKLIDRYKTKSVATLRDKLTVYADAQAQKLIAKGKEVQAEALRDRVDTIYAIMDSQPPATTVDELRARIRAMFVDGDDEPKPTLTLCTAHRSKGREWPRVFILGREAYMPSPFARQAWQLTQERNLIYVAITRAQSELIYVTALPK